jgi:hypothetical protein
MRSHNPAQIDTTWLWKFLRAGSHMENFSGADLSRLLRKIVQRETRITFQNHQLSVTVRLRVENNRGPGNADRDRFGRNLRAARILFRVKKNAAVIQTHVAAGFVQRENGILTESRDGQVRKGDFGTRIVSGPQRIAVVHGVVDFRRARRCLSGQNLNVMINGGDAALRRLILRKRESDECADAKKRGPTAA